MKEQGKFVLIIIDGVGVGALPDAGLYGDEGTNTLAHTAEAVGGLRMPHLSKLGIGNIISINGVSSVDDPEGCFGKMQESSRGKDSTTGHWEIGGIILHNDFPYYPNGFPEEVISNFCRLTGFSGVLGNKAASGTEIIQELGDEHMRTGLPIIYTSADSVFQIAAHDSVIPLDHLYSVCVTAREQILFGNHAVARVIARPFIGSSGNYERTAYRRDFSLAPPENTIFDFTAKEGIPTIAIGKIFDLYDGHGFSGRIATHSNQEGIEAVISACRNTQHGLIAVNLVDFDMLFGHRQDPKGLAAALESFDTALPEIMKTLSGSDILVITADHGNDPTDDSTDHTREYVPVIGWSPAMRKGSNLGIRKSFSDIGSTIGDYFGMQNIFPHGHSFLESFR